MLLGGCVCTGGSAVWKSEGRSSERMIGCHILHNCFLKKAQDITDFALWSCMAVVHGFERPSSKQRRPLGGALTTYYLAMPSVSKDKENVHCHPRAVAKDSSRLTYTLLYVYRGWLVEHGCQGTPVIQMAGFQMLLIMHTQTCVIGGLTNRQAEGHTLMISAAMGPLLKLF